MHARRHVNPWMVVQALRYLVLVHLILTTRGLDGLHRYVRAAKPADCGKQEDLQSLRRAFQLGRRLYFTRLRCLPCGAACALYLRRYGWPADVVLGIARRPFLAHVWVELEGRAILGTYDTSRYVVMDRI